jgi:hypothetical protein
MIKDNKKSLKGDKNEDTKVNLPGMVLEVD